MKDKAQRIKIYTCQFYQQEKAEEIPLDINGTTVPYHANAKYLGMTLDTNYYGESM